MRTFVAPRRAGHRARLAALAFAASLAGAALMPAACAADAVVTASASQPGLANLGAAPTAGAGRRVVVTGKLVGLEPPASGAVSIEVLLRPASGGPTVSVGRFSPYPATRIHPQASGQHQPFSVPASEALAVGSGGNWQAEFRITADGSPAAVRAEFADVKFATD